MGAAAAPMVIYLKLLPCFEWSLNTIAIKMNPINRFALAATFAIL